MDNNLEFKPEEFSLATIYKLLKRNKRFFLIFVIIFTIAVVVYSYIMPNTFVALSSILPPQKESSGGGLSSFIQNFAGGMDIGSIGQNDQSKLFAQILASRTVSDFIIEQLKLKELPEFEDMSNDQMYKFIHDAISSETDKSGVIYISVSYNTGFFPNNISKNKAAKLSADIANYAVKGLDKIIRERNVSSARRSKEYIETQIINYRGMLDSVALAMERFQKENKVISLDEQAQAIVTQAIDVGSQLAKAELELNLAKLEFQKNSPRLQYYNEQFNLLGEQYKKIQTGGLTNTDAFSIPLENLPTLMKEYADLFRQRKIFEQVIMFLETQHHEEAIQEKRDIPVVEVLDFAKIPEERYSPNRVAMTIVGFFLAIIFAIIIIVIRAFAKGNAYIVEFD